jgi:hypothetical protein
MKKWQDNYKTRKMKLKNKNKLNKDKDNNKWPNNNNLSNKSFKEILQKLSLLRVTISKFGSLSDSKLNQVAVNTLTFP